jgi:hypothetical protein
VALGDLTKQLAEQAIAGTIRSTTSKPEATPTVPAEDVGATIVGEIQAMQKALKEEDELLVLFHAGNEALRVVEIFMRSRNVLVLTGYDAEKNITRVVAHVEGLRLVCKVMKSVPGAKPVRISFVAPKPKP